MKRTLLLITFLICVFSNCFGMSIFSKKNDIASKEADGFLQLSSVNLELMPVGIKHPGIGLNYDFEKYIDQHIALTGQGGMDSYFGGWLDWKDFIVDISAGANLQFYPMYEALRGPYAGFGAGCDGMFYAGNNLPENAQRAFFYIKPELGWKFYIFDHFMIDVNAAYKKRFIMTPNELPDFYKDALDQGFHLGISFKFFMGK